MEEGVELKEEIPSCPGVFHERRLGSGNELSVFADQKQSLFIEMESSWASVSGKVVDQGDELYPGVLYRV